MTIYCNEKIPGLETTPMTQLQPGGLLDYVAAGIFGLEDIDYFKNLTEGETCNVNQIVG